MPYKATFHQRIYHDALMLNMAKVYNLKGNFLKFHYAFGFKVTKIQEKISWTFNYFYVTPLSLNPNFTFCNMHPVLMGSYQQIWHQWNIRFPTV